MKPSLAPYKLRTASAIVVGPTVHDLDLFGRTVLTILDADYKVMPKASQDSAPQAFLVDSERSVVRVAESKEEVTRLLSELAD
jgi:hypothetical protein